MWESEKARSQNLQRTVQSDDTRLKTEVLLRGEREGRWSGGICLSSNMSSFFLLIKSQYVAEPMDTGKTTFPSFLAAMWSCGQTSAIRK